MFNICQVIVNNNTLRIAMEIEDSFDRKKTLRKVRVKVRTNRNVDFITAIRHDATISDLANRALSVYLQLSEDAALPAIKKQLTVSAVKQGIFYMPKSEFVANLLNPDDEVEVVIIKAKPKYPNQIFTNQEFFAKHTGNVRINPNCERNGGQKPMEAILSQVQMSPIKPEHKEIKVLVPVVGEGSLSASKVSKRQKKKEKKKEKQEKMEKMEKKKKEEEPANLQKSQKKPNQQLEAKDIRDGQFSLQSATRKRLKFDKEESAQKAPQMVMPSPKITFHTQPKIDPPKVSLMNDSIKKKAIVEGQSRKPSEDLQRKNPFEKVTSPLMASKSPLIFQRTPNQQQQPQQNLKQKDKEQLSNFALSGRKLSEDQGIQIKKSKPKEQNASKEQQSKPLQGKIEEKIINTSKIEIEKKQEAKIDPVKIKATHSLIVVQQDDSDSEQNKKTNEVSNVHHRQRQLSEIQQQIRKYQLSEEEEN